MPGSGKGNTIFDWFTFLMVVVVGLVSAYRFFAIDKPIAEHRRRRRLMN